MHALNCMPNGCFSDGLQVGQFVNDECQNDGTYELIDVDQLLKKESTMNNNSKQAADNRFQEAPFTP